MSSSMSNRLLGVNSHHDAELEINLGYPRPKQVDYEHANEKEAEAQAKRAKRKRVRPHRPNEREVTARTQSTRLRQQPTRGSYITLPCIAPSINSTSATWSPSDYLENWEYYANVTAHPIEIEDNMRLSRLDAPALSLPTGPGTATVVFTRTQFDQINLNRSATSLWYYQLPFTDGYSAMPLTKPIWGIQDSQPQWDPYSRTVFFLSNRVSGSDAVGELTQIFQAEVPYPSTISSTVVEPVSYFGGVAGYLKEWMLGSEDLSQHSTSSSSRSKKHTPSSSHKSGFKSQSRRAAGDSSPLSDDVGTGPVLPDPSQSLTLYATPVQVSYFPVSVDNLLVGWTGDPNTARSLFAFSARVYPNMTMQQTADLTKQIKESGGNYMEFNKLFVRHWNEYMDGRRNHVFIMSISQGQDFSITSMSDPIDLMFGDDSDAPTRPDGSPDSEWSFATAATNFAFVKRTYDPESNVTWTTNLDIYTVSIPSSTGSTFSITAPVVCRTCDNKAVDTSPAYSTNPATPNAFVYLSSVVPGYESDRYRIRYLNDASTVPTEIAPNWMLSIGDVAWNAAGTQLYCTFNENARQKVALLNVTDGTLTYLLTEGSSGYVQVAIDDSFFIYQANDFSQPPNLYVYYYNASMYNVSIGELTTGFNAVALSKMQLSQTIDYQSPSINGTSIQAWFWLPVNFDSTKKYPLAFLIHGGPQDPWSNAWSFRWNPQIYAAAGYAVSMINFHGTPGWGQAFVDSIQGNYGSLPYNDLILGLDFLLEASNWKQNLDSNRLAALGASFGGYMINWIAGHNSQQNHPFNVLVCHDGMFDIYSWYMSTDELWFPEHDIGLGIGSVPWVNTTLYQKWNPAAPELLQNWNTPHMVIHGGLDYRIDQSQGLSSFTVLQRMGTPSQFLYFPQEAHQVFNPMNQLEWHHSVLEWIGQWTNTPTKQRTKNSRKLPGVRHERTNHRIQPQQQHRRPKINFN